MIDRYYTPENIASDIFLSLKGTEILSVADFAIGDGSLIKNLPFKTNNTIGFDLDPIAIKTLKGNNPEWNLCCGDFLSPDDDTRKWLSDFYNKVDLIVLNPPFSCKGNKRVTISISEKKFSCRPSIAFLYNALSYLSPNGILIAILPLSSVKSVIDNEVLSQIEKFWEISFGKKIDRGAFKGCSPNSIVVQLKRKKIFNAQIVENIVSPSYKFEVQILRGSTQMFTTKAHGSYPVLHTTNLQNGNVTADFKFSSNESKLAFGQYLCLPRVGKPSKEKVVLILEGTFILSDCLIGIKAKYPEQLSYLKRAIVENWKYFERLYESTCAPYITLNQLRGFLETIKIKSEIVPKFKTTGISASSYEYIDVDEEESEKVLTIN